MPTNLQTLLDDILDLEELDVNLFRGITPANPDNPFPRIFGGQTLAQTLVAGYRTVDPHLLVHSLHAYFLRPGNPRKPVIYRVGRIRDGRSFATRTVNATQNGETIFAAVVSFHVPEFGWEHQDPMPDVPKPENVECKQNIFSKYLKSHPELPDGIRKHLAQSVVSAFPLEMRPVEDETEYVENAWNNKKLPATKSVWMKASDKLLDDPRVHQCVAAYMSDTNLMSTSLRPHGKSLYTGDVKHASIDHAMWFHRPFRADEFLLYVCTSPQSAGARGLNFGKFYDQEGRHVISIAQEGLIRPIKRTKTNTRKKSFFRSATQRKVAGTGPFGPMIMSNL